MNCEFSIAKNLHKTNNKFPFCLFNRNLSITKWICPGGTDARFLRELNIPALGFMPLPNTPLKLHDNDEFIEADVYLNGINIYKQIIQNLGNV